MSKKSLEQRQRINRRTKRDRLSVPYKQPNHNGPGFWDGAFLSGIAYTGGERRVRVAHPIEPLRQVVVGAPRLFPRFNDRLCKNFPFGFGEKKQMNISIVHEDGSENEFEIDLCCDACALKDYGWSNAQFVKVIQSVDKGEPLKISDSIDSEVKFKEFVKTL